MFAATTGSPHVCPPSVEVLSDIPSWSVVPASGDDWNKSATRNVFASLHPTTGSPTRRLKKSAPGLRTPTSVNEVPRFTDREMPTFETPLLTFADVSSVLPLSRYATTTLVPHHAVDVWFCVKPPIAESVPSRRGSLTFPPVSAGVTGAAVTVTVGRVAFSAAGCGRRSRELNRFQRVVSAESLADIRDCMR